MRSPIVPVCVSSTWLDLEPERRAVEQAVQRLGETKFVGFVGREKEIADLLATLRRGGSAAVTGIGGIGKSELAYYVAERLRETYPDAQLVLDMRGTDDPPRELGDHFGEAAAHYNIALALYSSGDRANAILRAEAALKSFEQVESPYGAKVSATLAEWRREATEGA